MQAVFQIGKYQKYRAVVGELPPFSIHGISGRPLSEETAYLESPLNDP